MAFEAYKGEGTLRPPLGFEFATLTIPVLQERLFKSHLDLNPFKRMCVDYYPQDQAGLEAKEYERMNAKDRLNRIKKVATRCSDRVHKFKGYSWEQVFFESLAEATLPTKWFNYIFGHEADEEKTYLSVKKFLRGEFNSEEVHNTSRTKGGGLVRFADFTVVKKGILGSKIVSLDVKTNPNSFGTFLDQADDFQKFSYKTYLIATPGLILEAGRKYGRPAGAEQAITEKLERLGVGMYIADLTSGSFKRRLDAEEMDTDKTTRHDALRIMGVG